MNNWTRGASVIVILCLTLVAARGATLTELPIWIGCGVAILGGTWYGTKTQ